MNFHVWWQMSRDSPFSTCISNCPAPFVKKQLSLVLSAPLSKINCPLDGKGVWGRMDMCVSMAESLHRWRWTITALLIGFPCFAQSCPTLCDPMDCSPPCSRPWDSPDKNTGMGIPQYKIKRFYKKTNCLYICGFCFWTILFHWNVLKHTLYYHTFIVKFEIR